MRTSLFCLLLIGLINFNALADERMPVRVMSYNIRYLNTRDGADIWRHRSAKVIETLAQTDLFGLQEATFPQIQDVAAGLPEFRYYGVGRDDGKQKGEATPIFYRTALFEELKRGTFWLSPTPEVVGKAGWDAALPRIASWMTLKHRPSGKMLLIVNTHFDHKGKQARLESARLLAEKSPTLAGESPMPLIVMGDFNTVRGSQPYEVLAEADGWEDSYHFSQTEPTGPQGTFNGFKALQPDKHIDHIFVSEGTNVLSHQVLDPRTESGRFASDHHPILIQLGL